MHLSQLHIKWLMPKRIYMGKFKVRIREIIIVSNITHTPESIETEINVIGLCTLHMRLFSANDDIKWSICYFKT